jgi:hypothetical protein
VLSGKHWAMGQSVEALPPDRRVTHYRELANQSIRQAQGTLDQVHRAEFLAMAASWHSLAVEAERAIRSEMAAEFAFAERAQSGSVDPPKVGNGPPG